jgi:hypothetical protein
MGYDNISFSTKRLHFLILSFLIFISCNEIDSVVKKSVSTIKKQDYDTGIKVSDEINSIVDSVFSPYQLPSNDMYTIKVILSDENPDPDNKEGLECGTENKLCKWCGTSFTTPKVYNTQKSIFQLFSLHFKNFNLLVLLLLLLCSKKTFLKI